MSARDNGTEAPLRWPRVLGVLLLGWLVLELAGRIYVYYWAGVPYRSFAKYRWSPYGLVRNNPDLTQRGFQISPGGFRNREEFARQKPPRTLRVMLLGGSVLYSGLGGAVQEGAERVDSDHTIAQYLAEQLRHDPELAGLDVEVINAAVNFNRVKEVCVSYLSEHRFWEPDVVVVFGSANNFGRMPRKGQILRREFLVQEQHPWHAEFDRIANRKSFLSLGEQVIQDLEGSLVSVALARAGVERLVDRCLGLSKTGSAALRGQTPDDGTQAEAAGFEEYDRYIREYLGYVDAMTGAARRHDQKMVFFWEYWLGHMGDVKPLSDSEKILYRLVRKPNWQRDRDYDFYARDRLAEYCRKHDTALVDPLEELKSYRGSVFIDYLHYTAEGNELMAGVVYRQLRPLFHKEARRIRQECSTPGE